jgi:hypothetical protein
VVTQRVADLPRRTTQVGHHRILHLGKILETDEANALKRRTVDFALGTVVNPAVQM